MIIDIDIWMGRYIDGIYMDKTSNIKDEDRGGDQLGKIFCLVAVKSSLILNFDRSRKVLMDFDLQSSLASSSLYRLFNIQSYLIFPTFSFFLFLLSSPSFLSLSIQYFIFDPPHSIPLYTFLSPVASTLILAEIWFNCCYLRWAMEGWHLRNATVLENMDWKLPCLWSSFYPIFILPTLLFTLPSQVELILLYLFDESIPIVPIRFYLDESI